MDTSKGKLGTQRLRGLLRVIVRDLARDVVHDVYLTGAVRSKRGEPRDGAAAVAEEAAVEGGERAAGEGECGAAVVREEGVRVLEEGHHH